MLSSISSFLPSALHISNDKSPPTADEDRQLTQSPIAKDDEDMTVDEHGVKKKKDRTNEVCLLLHRRRTRLSRMGLDFSFASGWHGFSGQA